MRTYLIFPGIINILESNTYDSTVSMYSGSEEYSSSGIGYIFDKGLNSHGLTLTGSLLVRYLNISVVFWLLQLGRCHS